MSTSEGLVSCVGGCNSKLFSSRRVHRPLVPGDIHVNVRYHPQQKYKRTLDTNTPPIRVATVPNVKKSRKRRDRKASGSSQTEIRIDQHSDDVESSNTRRPFAVRFTLWFCGILIVILGLITLIYAIVVLFTSGDKLVKMLSKPWSDNNPPVRKFQFSYNN